MAHSLPSWLADAALPWVAEEASVFGHGPLLVADVAAADRLGGLYGELHNAIVIGVHDAGPLPEPADVFDILLTADTAPPRPWVQVQSVADTVAALGKAVSANPHAAVMLAQVLRAQQDVAFERALQIESFAYSTLLAGAEFRRWRATKARENLPVEDGPPVLLDRDGDVMRLTLARPGSENAMTAEMRDALVEALRVARADDAIRTVEIRGQGRIFSQGGAFDDFGTADDLALAHHIRTVRSAALALHRLGSRSRIFIHGAAVGSGIEFAAAGTELIAESTTVFALPEVSMGLIPGAGGTVTVARRIGRQRTCYLCLSGLRVRARTALAWGLVDRIADA